MAFIFLLIVVNIAYMIHKTINAFKDKKRIRENKRLWEKYKGKAGPLVHLGGHLKKRKIPHSMPSVA